MGHQLDEVFVTHWYHKGGIKTVEGIVEAENNVVYTPHSVEKINQLAAHAGWEGEPIPDKFTPKQKKERADRYHRLHDKYVRMAADRTIKKEQATDIFVEQQKNAGVKDKDINRGTGVRYAEEDLFDFSGTKEAAQYNAEVMQTFVDARNIGSELNKADRPKTEKELAVEEKFNGYHQKWINKINGYDLDKHLQNVKNDEYLVEHAEELQDIRSFATQIENIRNEYGYAHITIPQKMDKELETLSKKLSTFDEFTFRSDLIDSPYYAELDMDDVATQKIMLTDYKVQEKFSYARDHKHPGTSKESLLGVYQNDMSALASDYVAKELVAVRSLAERAGIPMENLMVQVGEDPARQLFKIKSDNNIRSEDLNKMYTHEISKVTFFDKNDPTHKLEWPSGTENDHPFVRALEEMDKPAPKSVPEPGLEPKKPGRFKRFMNTVFGAYKKDFENYNRQMDDYKAQVASYDEYQRRSSVRKIATDFGVKEPPAQQEQPEAEVKQEKKQNDLTESKSTEKDLVSSKGEKTLDDGYKRFEVKQTKTDMKFDKVNTNTNQAPGEENVAAWARGAREKLNECKDMGIKSRAVGFAEMGFNAFSKVKTMIADNRTAEGQLMNPNKIVPSTYVMAMGMYQMFYNEEGKLSDSYKDYQDIKTNNIKPFTDSISKQLQSPELQNKVNVFNVTLGNFTKNMQENKPIFPKDVQETLMNGYKKDMGAAQKDNKKTLEQPKKIIEPPVNNMVKN